VGSTFAKLVNDCYPEFDSDGNMMRCRFENRKSYVRYITIDREYGDATEALVVALLWGTPNILWQDFGRLSPGMLAYVPQVPPIHLVYSNGNHYDALFYLLNQDEMLQATLNLHKKVRCAIALARAGGVIDLEEDMDVEESPILVGEAPVQVAPEPRVSCATPHDAPSAANIAVCLKENALESRATKSAAVHVNGGVRKAHGK
jgi:hypothetical protein